MLIYELIQAYAAIIFIIITHCCRCCQYYIAAIDSGILAPWLMPLLLLMVDDALLC